MSTHPTPRPTAPMVYAGDDLQHFAVFNENSPSIVGLDWFHVGLTDAQHNVIANLVLSPEAVITLAGLFDDLRDDVIAWQAQGEPSDGDVLVPMPDDFRRNVRTAGHVPGHAA